MKIDFSPYELIRKSKANAKVEDVTQKGTLIRLTDANQNWGVADICPWPALGDLDLASEIKNKGSLYLRAIELALEDLQARKENKSLLRDQWVKNNILVNTQTPNTSGTTKFYAIGLAYSSTTGNYTGLSSNNNDLFTTTGANYFVGITGGLAAGTTRTFAAWQTETGRDGASKNVLPVNRFGKMRIAMLCGSNK